MKNRIKPLERLSPQQISRLRKTRFTGRRSFDGGSNYKFVGLTAKNKTEAMAANQALRSMGYDARAVKIKSIGGRYGVYVRQSPTRMQRSRLGSDRIFTRRYNAIRFPWQSFEVPGGIDQPALVDWMRSQPGYNTNLDWRENIRLLGGNEAVNAFNALTDVNRAVMDQALKQEANFTAAALLDEMLAETDFGSDAGFTPRTRQEIKEEAGGGLDFDFMTVDDPENPGMSITKASDEVDIYDMLGIDVGQKDAEMDEIFSQIDAFFDDTFDGGEGKLLPQNVKTSKEQAEVLVGAVADEERETMQASDIDSLLNSFLDEELFADQMMNDEIKWAGKTFRREDVLSQSTLNPALGVAQAPVGDSPAGYWTFTPAKRGESIRFDKKPAFVVVTSAGQVISAKPYTDESNTSEYYDAMRNALNNARIASSYDMYTSAKYQEHDQLSPGVAVVAAYLTLDDAGGIVGWEVDGRSEDFRLEAGEFQIFLDGEQVEDPSKLPRSYLANWRLPQVGGRKDPTLESLGFDFEADTDMARMAAARLAKEGGAQASEIEAILKGYRYRAYDAYSQNPVTIWAPSMEAILKTIKELQGSAEPTDYAIGRTVESNGMVDAQNQELYASLLWDPERMKHVVDFE